MADYKGDYKRLSTTLPDVQVAELLVCLDCGAIVHPNYSRKHDIEHEWSENTAERLDHIEGI